MNELSAYRMWHAQERATIDFKKKLHMIDLTIQGIEMDMFRSAVEQYKNDMAFVRATRRFTGYTQYGWEIACGSDGRLIKLGRRIGWPMLSKLILAVREYYES